MNSVWITSLIDAVMARGDLFDDTRASFFGVTIDPADEAGRVQARLPGYRYFWDTDGLVGKLYGALARDFQPDGRRLRGTDFGGGAPSVANREEDDRCGDERAHDDCDGKCKEEYAVHHGS